jgi:threonine aldolase
VKPVLAATSASSASGAAAGFDLKAIKTLRLDLLVVGGTKAGMPPTEAVVIFDRALARRFDARLKQAGQLPSKGRFYAAPFIGMLDAGAFVRHAAHANAMARKLAELMPFPVTHPVEANGVFVQMDDAALARLHAEGWFVYRFLDGSVRFMCSWATTPEAVESLGEILRQLS